MNLAENGIKIDFINKLRYTGIPQILQSKYEKCVKSAEIQKILKKEPLNNALVDNKRLSQQSFLEKKKWYS